MQNQIQKISSAISKILTNQSKIVIFSHMNPDGDAVGSSLGLFHYLKSRVNDVVVILPNKFPEFLSFLPGSDKVLFFDQDTNKAVSSISSADFIFYLDFNDPARINKMGELAAMNKCTRIMIDHHPQPVDFADYSISEISVCSTAELVFEFVAAASGGKFLDKDMANCLLAGIITDTGLFNHNSERQRTFEIVGELLEMGGDKTNIIQKIYNDYPFSRMQLLGNALHNRLNYYPQFGTAFIYLPKSDLDKYNHQVGDTEGFVNIPLSISGIKFSAIFLEKEDHVKCSFRSTGNFDVNTFARNYYSGGGHLNASGGKSFETLNKTIETFVMLIEKHQDEIKQNI